MAFGGNNFNMNQNWNNMYNNNNMNMNNFINNNMTMNNNINNPMANQMNAMLMQFYNQMQQQLNFQMQLANMKSYAVNNNSQSTDRLPKNQQEITTDPFFNIPGPRANLIFQTSKGHKITLSAPYNVKVHDVLVEYIKKCGLGPNALYDGFYFLFNGAQIKIKDKTQLVQDLTYIGKANQSHIVIVVVDTKNLIGS